MKEIGEIMGKNPADNQKKDSISQNPDEARIAQWDDVEKRDAVLSNLNAAAFAHEVGATSELAEQFNKVTQIMYKNHNQLSALRKELQSVEFNIKAKEREIKQQNAELQKVTELQDKTTKAMTAAQEEENKAASKVDALFETWSSNKNDKNKKALDSAKEELGKKQAALSKEMEAVKLTEGVLSKNKLALAKLNQEVGVAREERKTLGVQFIQSLKQFDKTILAINHLKGVAQKNKAAEEKRQNTAATKIQGYMSRVHLANVTKATQAAKIAEAATASYAAASKAVKEAEKAQDQARKTQASVTKAKNIETGDRIKDATHVHKRAQTAFVDANTAVSQTKDAADLVQNAAKAAAKASNAFNIAAKTNRQMRENATTSASTAEKIASEAQKMKESIDTHALYAKTADEAVKVAKQSIEQAKIDTKIIEAIRPAIWAISADNEERKKNMVETKLALNELTPELKVQAVIVLTDTLLADPVKDKETGLIDSEYGKKVIKILTATLQHVSDPRATQDEAKAIAKELITNQGAKIKPTLWQKVKQFCGIKHKTRELSSPANMLKKQLEKKSSMRVIDNTIRNKTYGRSKGGIER